MIAHSPAGTLPGRQDQGRDRRRRRAVLGACGVRNRAVLFHVKRHESASIKREARMNAFDMQRASMTNDADDRSNSQERLAQSVLCGWIEYYRGSVPPIGFRCPRMQSGWKCGPNAIALCDGTAMLCQEKVVSSEAEILGHLDDRDRNANCHVAVWIFSWNHDWRGLANLPDSWSDFPRTALGRSRRAKHMEIVGLASKDRFLTGRNRAYSVLRSMMRRCESSRTDLDAKTKH